jgi:membrane protease YdiL (CAAX protease family)
MINMPLNFKNSLKILVLIILLIPLFFGFNLKYIFRLNLDFFPFILIIIGVFLLFLGGRLIPRYIFTPKELNRMKEHEIVAAFSEKSYQSIIIFFPITMLVEELIFRYYILGVLTTMIELNFAILISALAFSLYHLHIWFGFKDLRVLSSYMVYSLLLGILNGYIFYYLGIILCILVHMVLVLDIYYVLSKRLEKSKIRNWS